MEQWRVEATSDKCRLVAGSMVELSMNRGVAEEEAEREERGEREAAEEVDEVEDEASAAGNAEKMPVFSLVYTSITCGVVGSIVIMTRQSSATSAGDRATRTAAPRSDA